MHNNKIELQADNCIAEESTAESNFAREVLADAEKAHSLLDISLSAILKAKLEFNKLARRRRYLIRARMKEEEEKAAEGGRIISIAQ